MKTGFTLAHTRGMLSINMFFYVLALVLFLLAGLNVPCPPRFSMGWLGMFFALLAFLWKF